MRKVELAAVYDAVQHCVPRPTSSVRPTPGGAVPGWRQGPETTGKWLTALIIDDVDAVVEAGFDEAARRDPQHAHTLLVPVDGNRTQIKAVIAQAIRRSTQREHQSGLIRVLEHFPKGPM